MSLLLPLNKFHTLFGVAIVDFEQVNGGWVDTPHYRRTRVVDFNPFRATGLFLFLLKTYENERVSDVFRGCRKISVA